MEQMSPFAFVYSCDNTFYFRPLADMQQKYKKYIY